jgi:hypothetical protein
MQAPPEQEPGTFWHCGGVVQTPPQGKQSPFMVQSPPSQAVPASSWGNEHVSVVPLHVPGALWHESGAFAQAPGHIPPLVPDTPLPLTLAVADLAPPVPAPPEPNGVGAPMPRIASHPQAKPAVAPNPSAQPAQARRFISSSLPRCPSRSRIPHRPG